MSPLGPLFHPALVAQQPQPPGIWIALASAVLTAGLVSWGILMWLRHRSRRAQLPDMAGAAELWDGLTLTLADPAEIAETAYLHFARRFEADFFQVGIFEDGDFSTLISVRDGTRQRKERFPLTGADPGMVGWVRAHRQPILINDLDRQGGSLPTQPSYHADDPPRSGVFVPLLAHDTIIGVMAVQSRKAGAYGKQHLAAIQALASPIAVALYAVQLKAHGADQARQLTLLRGIASLMTTLKPLNELLPEVATLLQTGYGFDQVRIYERTEAHLVLRALAGQDGGIESSFPMNYPAPIPQAAAAAATVRELKRSERPRALPSIQAASIPLRVEGRMLGVLHIRAKEGETVEPESITLAETVANHLAMVMLEADNFAQQQEEAWVTTVLLEAARHAAQPGDTVDALQAVLRLTTLLAGTSWAILLLPDPATHALEIGPSAGLRRLPPGQQAVLGLQPEALGLSPPFREGEEIGKVDLPERLQDLTSSTRALALSLSDGESLLGVLLLEALDMPGDRPALLKGIAHQISLRIENARLVEQVVEQVSARRSLEREIAMARDIQTSFLPRTIPEYAGWDIGVTWQLARMVGGDFYDFFQLPDGPNGPRWAIVIADVADKGVPASLFMALSRTLIRSVAFSRVDPSQTLQRANDLIISDSQSTMFVSVVKGLWEPAIARFSFANGGHNPPILVLPEEEPRVMTQHGMVLGVREDEQYQTQVVELPPGSAVVLYTDGVTEAMNRRGEAFGANRLCATIHEQNDCTAQSLSDLIRQRVTEFCENVDLDDDLTTVILRRLPSSAWKPHLQNGRSA